MSAVTKPMALDETLQDVVDALPSPAQGAAGKTAYASAVSGGYTMPEGQFNADLEGLKTRCNPNLLDNAYFVGGGDQQGGGQFPINQKRQTTYSASGYTIDRWSSLRANTVTLESDGLKFTYSTGQTYQMLYFTGENVKDLVEKTVTLSVLIEATALCYMRIIWASTSGAYASLKIPANTSGLLSVTAQIPSSATLLQVDIGSITTRPTSGYFKIKAIKLELGSEQTLAHLENGVWVLNEIPDYETQLLRCQRFYRVFTANTAASTGYGYSTNAKDLRPEMRTNPTAETFTVDGVTYYALNANL